jgi:hypothetical protein
MTQLIENKPRRRALIATLSHFSPRRRRFVGRNFSSDITDDAQSAYRCADSSAACISFFVRSSRSLFSNRRKSAIYAVCCLSFISVPTFELKAKGVASGFEEERDGGKVRTRKRNSESCPKREGMQGMFGDEGHLGAFAAVPDLRACGMLRQLEEQARHEAFSSDASSNHSLVRTRRGLALVLCGRDHGLIARAATESSRRENRAG